MDCGRAVLFAVAELLVHFSTEIAHLFSQTLVETFYIYFTCTFFIFIHSHAHI